MLQERGLDFIHMTSAEVKAKTGPKRGESTSSSSGGTRCGLPLD